MQIPAMIANRHRRWLYPALAIAILAGAVYMRFWNVPKLFFFDIDEEYQALIAQTIVRDFHIIWIGLSAADTGFYMGPGFTYLNALLFWISHGDPVILAYFSASLGVVTAITLYMTSRDLFGRRAATVASVLYSFSAFSAWYDRRFWNSTFVPIVVILYLYSLAKARHNPRWLLVTAALFGCALHIHFSLMVFIGIIPVAIAAWVRLPRKTIPIVSVGSAAIVAALGSPLIVYDLVHNFDNLKTPLRLLHNLGTHQHRFQGAAHIRSIVDTMSQFWIYRSSLEVVTSLLGLLSVGIIVAFAARRKSVEESLVLLIVGVYLALFALYPGMVYEYYLLGIFPLICIMTGIIVARVPVGIVAVGLLLFATINVRTMTSWPLDRGLSAKKHLVTQITSQVKNQSFYLTADRPYIGFGGWRYLFSAYGRIPASSEADEMFGYLYRQEIEATAPTLTVVVSDRGSHAPNSRRQITSGAYRAYILPNHSGP